MIFNCFQLFFHLFCKDFQRFSIVFKGFPWCQRFSMLFNCFSCFSMIFDGFSMILEVFCLQWFLNIFQSSSMIFDGFQLLFWWLSMIFQGFQWFSIVFQYFLWFVFLMLLKGLQWFIYNGFQKVFQRFLLMFFHAFQWCSMVFNSFQCVF